MNQKKKEIKGEIEKNDERKDNCEGDEKEQIQKNMKDKTIVK